MPGQMLFHSCRRSSSATASIRSLSLANPNPVPGIHQSVKLELEVQIFAEGAAFFFRLRRFDEMLPHVLCNREDVG